MRRVSKIALVLGLAAALQLPAALADAPPASVPTTTSDVLLPNAGCTPHATAPTLVSGNIIAHGSISCTVSSGYKYQVCSQAWHPLPRGGGEWEQFSCGPQISARACSPRGRPAAVRATEPCSW